MANKQHTVQNKNLDAESNNNLINDDNDHDSLDSGDSGIVKDNDDVDPYAFYAMKEADEHEAFGKDLYMFSTVR